MTRFIRLVSLAAALVLGMAGCGGGGSSVLTPPGTSSSGSSTSLAVSNLNDSGAGSLRSAILAANALPASSSSTITFAVSGTIVLASDLPAIDKKVKIDATSAPARSASTQLAAISNSNAPLIELNANNHAAFVFASGSAGSQLLGIAVDNAGGNGVTLDTGSIMLNQNYIGLNLAGAAFGNRGDGVYISALSSNNLIGLNTSSASGVVSNVISGNLGNGVSLVGTSGNTLVANRIGTNPGGSAAIANGQNGIYLTLAAHDNEIGGTAFVDSATGQTNNPTGDKGTVPAVFVVPPLGNLVSGNKRNGILIEAASVKNVLNGNFVGTTANGDAAIANVADGVLIRGASDNSLIGCLFANNPFVYYNVLSGNGANGLHINNSDRITVQANFFGIGANNTTVVANALDGILVDGTSKGTQVGGVIPLGNVSAGNTHNGIEVGGSASSFTTFNTFGGILAFKGGAGNGNDGLLITSTGGNQTVRTNVFSGNVNNGIEIAGDASGVAVDPNIAGLNTVGSGIVANGGDGILLTGTAHDNVIGGYLGSVIPQNTFSGNGNYGIALIGRAHDNQVFNNYVGTSVPGLAAMPNGHGGVYVGGSATNDMIGGVSTDSSMPKRNLISGNTGIGVTLAAGTSNIGVVDNSIGLDRFGRSLLPNSGLPIVVSPGSINSTVVGNVTAL